jgi:L-alanine-DL-glutamate epimerase-like enolase superfamily enzyme
VAAPASIAHTHVHSLRVAGGAHAGAEALVARVRLAGGGEGHGFTLNEDAAVARDMAAWDALGRCKGMPLWGLLGGTYRKKIPTIRDEHPAVPSDWSALRKGILENRYGLLRIDPFAWGSVEMVQTIAAVAQAFDLGIALLAPNAHPWELQYCAALGATIKGEDTRIIVRKELSEKEMKITEAPGIDIDWSLEPSFSKIQWQS